MRIRTLRDIRAHARCPECARFIYDRSATGEKVQGGNDLYQFKETCHNCGWSCRVENVDLGA